MELLKTESFPETDCDLPKDDKDIDFDQYVAQLLQDPEVKKYLYGDTPEVDLEAAKKGFLKKLLEQDNHQGD